MEDNKKIYCLAWLDSDSFVHVMPLLTFSDLDTAFQAREIFSKSLFATRPSKKVCVVLIDEDKM